MDKQNQKSLNIFDYENYRPFLKDYYETKKWKEPEFSYRVFARQAGFQSPNFYKRVVDGQRNLGAEGIEQFAKGLGLTKEEKAFFKTLVLFNQAKKPQEKQKHAIDMLRSKIFQRVSPLAKVQYFYWSKWYNIVIREMVGFSSFREDPHWIAERIIPPISAKDAQNSLNQLVELGLLKRNPKGKLVQSNMNVTTGQEIISSAVTEFHRQMLERAQEALHLFPIDQREISTITLALTENTKKKIKEMIVKFGEELIAVSNEDKDYNKIYQINFQLFPISKPLDEEEV